MELDDRLRRLGVLRGTGHLKSRPAKRQPPRTAGRDIERWVAGQTIQNEQGSFFLTEETYPLDHRHGGESLSSLLEQPQHIFARFSEDISLCQLDLRRAAFIDTETTGLAGGTGTYAFLIGVGYFDDEGFCLRQFFMRDYSEEPALLHYVAETLDGLQSIVSFNGRSFDLPLLETRFLLSRLRPDLLDAPHLDLLLPARRLWRARLSSCALSSLEENVLGVRRDTRDVPGFLIPHLYFRYMQTGDAGEIYRVFYHNAQDILSLVTLTSHIAALFQAPSQGHYANGLDMFSLGRLCEKLGLLAESEQAYRHALRDTLVPEVQAMIEQHLSFVYKRTGRWEEAIGLWERLRSSAQAGTVSHIELAKYYEHRAHDYGYAISLVLQARRQLIDHPHATRHPETLVELDHRINRLRSKLQR